MNKIGNNTADLSINYTNEILKGLTIHTNIKQELITTDVDKIKLVLIGAKKSMLAKREWITPFSLLITLITTILTADFYNVFWYYCFIILSFFCFGWLLYTFVRLLIYKKKDDIEQIINQLKLNKSDVIRK